MKAGFERLELFERLEQLLKYGSRREQSSGGEVLSTSYV